MDKVNGIPVIRRVMGKVTGIPDVIPPGGVIVSAMVLAAIAAGTPDIFAPDTGPTAIRDEKGHIVAVTRLVAA